MNDNDSGTRSFDPPKPEEPKAAKSSKPDVKKIVTVAIFAVAILIVVLFCAIIIAEIVYKVKGNAPVDTDKLIDDVKYTTVDVSSSEMTKGDLIIINADRAMGESLKSEVLAAAKNVYAYNNDKKKTDSTLTIRYNFLNSDTIKLLPNVIDSFNAMTNALYDATGCSEILLAYGLLTPKPSTLACDFIHEAGQTVDIKLITVDGTYKLTTKAEVFSWLNANCAKYGFVNSYPVSTANGFISSVGSAETPHGSDELVASAQYRYVGVAHATYIAANNLTVDSYVAQLKANNVGSDKALLVTVNQGAYLVYYVASTGDTTSVSVPENYSYTISGDNVGGYIVTIDLTSKK